MHPNQSLLLSLLLAVAGSVAMYRNAPAGFPAPSRRAAPVQRVGGRGLGRYDDARRLDGRRRLLSRRTARLPERSCPRRNEARRGSWPCRLTADRPAVTVSPSSAGNRQAVLHRRSDAHQQYVFYLDEFGDPWWEPSRPIPDCLTPPSGATQCRIDSHPSAFQRLGDANDAVQFGCVEMRRQTVLG